MLVDVAFLRTLPAAELAAGRAEVIKTALIAGGRLWDAVRAGRFEDSETVLQCATTKLAVVATDERDAGRRQVLNLGHTVGHALETATGYARLRHGEAVGLGLLAALRLSGLDDLRAEVAALLERAGLPTALEALDVDAVVAATERDKKRRGDEPVPFVLVAAPGDVRQFGLDARFFQTNAEHHFVEHLHRLEGLADGIVLNPGAWTHYSYAIRDALEITGLPAVEVHLSDVEHREPWRRVSVIRELCLATVSGEGPEGYRRAFERLRQELGR